MTEQGSGPSGVCCQNQQKRRRYLWKTVKHALFCVLKFFVRVFYRRPHIDGVDNLPTEPCILVGNHTQMNGPLVAELYLPGKRYIWCAGEMMHLKEVPAYAYRISGRASRGIRVGFTNCYPI